MAQVRPNRVQEVRDLILNLPRVHKQTAMILSDVVGVVICVWGAAWLAAGVAALSAADMILLTVVTVVVTIPIAWHEGLYRSIIRYMGADLFVAGSKTTLAVTVLVGVLLPGLAAARPAYCSWSVSVSLPGWCCWCWACWSWCNW